MEKVIKSTEQVIGAVLDSLSEIITYQDIEHRVLWANRAAVESVDLALEQLVGRHCYEIWHQSEELCMGCPLEKAIKTGKPQEGEITTPDGREWRIRGYPVRDVNNNIVGITEVMWDITEHKQAEEELRKYMKAFEGSEDLIFAVDRQYVYLVVNGAFLKYWCRPRNQVIGRTIAEVIGEDLFESKVKPNIDRCLQGKSVRGDLEIEYPKLGKRHMRFSYFPTKSGDEGITGLVAIVRDITERKRLEDQLRQTAKMEAIGQLAGGVAHDFNNLLTIITGYTELLLHHLDESFLYRKDLEEIKKAGDQATSLVRRLLAFSRRQVLQPKVLDLNIVISGTAKMLRRLIGEDIELETFLATQLAPVKVDPTQIEQIIINLVVNARDAMPQGGKLTLRTENVTLDEDFCRWIPELRPGRFVCLSIEDTGVGMDKEIIQHIFEPFFTTKEPGVGTGLGLSVVYGIVKQHEGWIDVSSKPGQGSTFKVYLPAFSVKLEDKTEERISLQEFQGRGERILLVEDEKGVLEFTKRVLGENGYIVSSATNAKEALDIFEKEKGRFHLVLSDVVLPDKSGLELVDELLKKNPELRILLCSGYTGKKSQWSIIRERGFRFLQKPYALADLLRAIRNAIQS